MNAEGHIEKTRQILLHVDGLAKREIPIVELQANLALAQVHATLAVAAELRAQSDLMARSQSRRRAD